MFKFLKKKGRRGSQSRKSRKTKKTVKSGRVVKYAMFAGFSTVVIGGMLFLWIRYKEYRDVVSAEFNQLENQRFGKLNLEDIERSFRTRLLVFKITQIDGIYEVSDVAVVDVGNWVLHIPSALYVGDNNDGWFKVEKLYSVGDRLIPNQSGLDYLTSELEGFLAIRIDGYIAVESSSLDTPWGICDAGFEKPEAWKKFNKSRMFLRTEEASELGENTNTNMDMEGVLGVAELMRDEDIVCKEMRLEDATSIDDQGRIIKVYETERVDEIVRGFPSQSELYFEQAKVEIYNGTSVTGLASQYARRVRNAGLEVARIEDSPEYFQRTTIYMPKDEDFGNSLEAIRRELYGIIPEIREEAPDLTTNADIIVVLGRDAVDE